jgi:hypothetical protein
MGCLQICCLKRVKDIGQRDRGCERLHATLAAKQALKAPREQGPRQHLAAWAIDSMVLDAAGVCLPTTQDHHTRCLRLATQDPSALPHYIPQHQHPSASPHSNPQHHNTESLNPGTHSGTHSASGFQAWKVNGLELIGNERDLHDPDAPLASAEEQIHPLSADSHATHTQPRGRRHARTWWSLRGDSEEQWCTHRHDRARKRRKLPHRHQQPLQLVLQVVQVVLFHLQSSLRALAAALAFPYALV